VSTQSYDSQSLGVVGVNGAPCERGVGSEVSSGCWSMFESKWSGVWPRVESTWRFMVSRIVEAVVAQSPDVAAGHSSYLAGHVVARVSLVKVCAPKPS